MDAQTICFADRDTGEEFDHFLADTAVKDETIFLRTDDVAKLVDPTTEVVIYDAVADSEKRWRK